METVVKRTGKIIGVAIALIFIFAACAEKITFQNSAVVPAAEGTVSIKKDNNNNYAIDLEVQNLADPGRLTPPSNVYVVWVETAQSGIQNIGQLKTSTRGMSKGLTATLKTVTSHKPSSIFITAEDNSEGQYPGMTVVLKTEVINR